MTIRNSGGQFRIKTSSEPVFQNQTRSKYMNIQSKSNFVGNSKVLNQSFLKDNRIKSLILSASSEFN